ncbi:MAG: ligA [Spirochaetes bacterium]|nr:MAG: ligA [Spirochaetota bacterium]
MATSDNELFRVEELERLIVHHQNLYYNAQPEISDEEFDSLWQELEDLDPDNSLLRRVGPDNAQGWGKARHLIPMGSQSKASDPEEFRAWAQKSALPFFLVQYKMDGASLEIQYEAGVFLKAVTRGDGTIGDDISRNVLSMKGVVVKIPDGFSGGVRGEVLMSRETHRLKYPEKANCRNAANGLMKRKDGTGSEDLEFICYDARGLCTDTGKSPFDDEISKLEWLRRAGFTVVRTEVLQGIDAVVEYRGKVMAQRPTLPFDIDGLVVKSPQIDEEDLEKPRPEKQIAFKFNPEEAVTILKEIVWNESGALYTPIGIVAPVKLAGTTVQRANLCNPDMIRQMNLKLGSKVVITKRGEIIPKIEVLVENGPDVKDIPQPSLCRRCATTLVDEGSRLFCPNELCPNKELHRIEKWISILEIRDFGAALVRKLHAQGLVKSISDLYLLEQKDLLGLERMGETLSLKLLHNLRKKNEIDMADYIAAFDIDNVGPLVARKLVDGGLDTLEALFNADTERLVAINGIGEIMAITIQNGLKAIRPEMEKVLAKGYVRLRRAISKSPLAGKKICFTGELNGMSRAEASALARKGGGVVKNSVTTDLDYLVTDDSSTGSSKNKKAKELGIPILTGPEFLAIARSES